MFFKNSFWLCKVEVSHYNEFLIWVHNSLALAHFEEAVDEDDEFLDTGGKYSVHVCTLATDFCTEFLADQQLFKDCTCPRNCTLPEWSSL
jgi:hypothetical protein